MRGLVFFALFAFATLPAFGQIPAPALKSSMRTIDLNVGETRSVTMSDGKKVIVRLVDLQESRDSLRNAVREAKATIEIDGQKTTLVSANYRLPMAVGGILVDCPVTKGYRANAIK